MFPSHGLTGRQDQVGEFSNRADDVGGAALLESTTAMPVLLLNRRSLDTDGRPIELVRALYRGDRVAFETLLT